MFGWGAFGEFLFGGYVEDDACGDWEETGVEESVERSEE